jgi:hypothetical protein
MSVFEKYILFFLLIPCVSGVNAQTVPHDTITHKWSMGMFMQIIPMKYGSVGFGPEATYSYGLGYETFFQTSLRVGYAGDFVVNPSGRYYAALRASAGLGMNSPVHLSIGVLYLQPFATFVDVEDEYPKRADVISKNLGIHTAVGVWFWKFNAAVEMGGCRYFLWFGATLSGTIDQW